MEPANLPEGTEVFVTVAEGGEPRFWLHATETTLDAIWNNPEDDVYEQLLTV